MEVFKIESNIENFKWEQVLQHASGTTSKLLYQVNQDKYFSFLPSTQKLVVVAVLNLSISLLRDMHIYLHTYTTLLCMYDIVFAKKN